MDIPNFTIFQSHISMDQYCGLSCSFRPNGALYFDFHLVLIPISSWHMSGTGRTDPDEMTPHGLTRRVATTIEDNVQGHLMLPFNQYIMFPDVDEILGGVIDDVF